MTELEKVIKGLECCTADLMEYHRDHFCDMCPYKSTNPKITYCFNKCDLMRDALTILKAQEPRVLTLEEVRERKPFHLWAEDMETGALVFPVAYVGGLYVDSAEDWSVDPDHRNTPEYYGKSWRFWDKKPTNEQKEAVKWDADISR